jgi:hypothetical protein
MSSKQIARAEIPRPKAMKAAARTGTIVTYGKMTPMNAGMDLKK